MQVRIKAGGLILTNKEKNQAVYQLAYNYLIDNLPNELSVSDLQKYFIGDRRDFSSLADVYEQIILSAQNYQSMPNVINFAKRKKEIKMILFDYDFVRIATHSTDDLHQILERNLMLQVKTASVIAGINGVIQ